MTGKASEVIARFGGQSALARSLGLNQSTVQHWAKTGQIPVWRHEEVLRVARERGIPLERGELGSVRDQPGGTRTAGAGGAVRALRPSLGFGRAAGAAALGSEAAHGLAHGRADALPTLEGELGAMREQIGQLSEVVRRLVDEVAALRRAEASEGPAHPQPGSGLPPREGTPRRRSPR